MHMTLNKQANNYEAGTFRAIKILELSIASTITFPITGRVKEHFLRILLFLSKSCNIRHVTEQSEQLLDKYLL